MLVGQNNHIKQLYPEVESFKNTKKNKFRSINSLAGENYLKNDDLNISTTVQGLDTHLSPNNEIILSQKIKVKKKNHTFDINLKTMFDKSLKDIKAEEIKHYTENEINLIPKMKIKKEKIDSETKNINALSREVQTENINEENVNNSLSGIIFPKNKHKYKYVENNTGPNVFLNERTVNVEEQLERSLETVKTNNIEYSENDPVLKLKRKIKKEKEVIILDRSNNISAEIENSKDFKIKKKKNKPYTLERPTEGNACAILGKNTKKKKRYKYADLHSSMGNLLNVYENGVNISESTNKQIEDIHLYRSRKIKKKLKNASRNKNVEMKHLGEEFSSADSLKDDARNVKTPDDNEEAVLVQSEGTSSSDVIEMSEIIHPKKRKLKKGKTQLNEYLDIPTKENTTTSLEHISAINLDKNKKENFEAFNVEYQLKKKKRKHSVNERKNSNSLMKELSNSTLKSNKFSDEGYIDLTKHDSDEKSDMEKCDSRSVKTLATQYSNKEAHSVVTEASLNTDVSEISQIKNSKKIKVKKEKTQHNEYLNISPKESTHSSLEEMSTSKINRAEPSIFFNEDQRDNLEASNVELKLKKKKRKHRLIKSENSDTRMKELTHTILKPNKFSDEESINIKKDYSDITIMDGDVEKYDSRPFTSLSDNEEALAVLSKGISNTHVSEISEIVSPKKVKQKDKTQHKKYLDKTDENDVSEIIIPKKIKVKNKVSVEENTDTSFEAFNPSKNSTIRSSICLNEEKIKTLESNSIELKKKKKICSFNISENFDTVLEEFENPTLKSNEDYIDIKEHHLDDNCINSNVEKYDRDSSQTNTDNTISRNSVSFDSDSGALYKTDTVSDLKDLNIDINFPVPRLHKILNRSTKPTLKQREQLSKYNLVIKSGKYSKVEDDQIKANWDKFTEEYNVENKPEIFFSLDKKHISNAEKQKFLWFISQNLPDRAPSSIFARFKRLLVLTEKKKGRFTKDEDYYIKKTMKETSCRRNYMAQIAEYLQRPFTAVEGRIKKLQQVHTRKIKWRKNNVKMFLKYLMKITKVKDITELKNRHITSKQYQHLSKKLDNVPVRILINAWLLNIHPRLFIPKNTCNVTKVKLKLISMLYKNGEKDFRTVNWSNYAAHFEGFTPLKIYSLFILLVNTRIPKHKRNNLRKCLKLLVKLNKEDLKAHVMYKIIYKNGEVIDLKDR